MKTYSVGEICKLCNVTVKKLRYYEEKGILSPVPRDENNNFRYYTQEHIYELTAARALKDSDMSLSNVKDVIHGKSVDDIKSLLEQQKKAAFDQITLSLNRYEHSTVTYTKLMEALSVLRLDNTVEQMPLKCEIVEREEQNIVAIPYSATWEDETCYDIEHLPKIQELSLMANSYPVNTLLYLTYDHFDSTTCTFDNKVHEYKIATPVSGSWKGEFSDTIPAYRGISAIHVGDPKNEQLYSTYIHMLEWAKSEGYHLANWSVEEWLISPLITGNKDFWVIRITIPFRD